MDVFATKNSISPLARLEQMRQNILRWKVGRLRDISRVGLPKTWALACYGPSLEDTWEKLGGMPVVSVSGAYDFLIERGITPKYHVECDPRVHKAAFLTKPNKETVYCIASCCHPKVFEVLKGCEILMWHLAEEPIETMREMLRKYDLGSKLVGGGTTVGTRAMSVMDVLGIRKIDIHGMDCSYRGAEVWPGPHSGEIHIGRFKNEIAGKVFDTSTTMFNAMLDFFELLDRSHADYALFGDGMLAHAVRSGIRLEADLLHPVDHIVVRVEVPDEMAA